MTKHTISTLQDFTDLKDYALGNSYKYAKVLIKYPLCFIQFEDHEEFEIELKSFSVTESNEIYKWVKQWNPAPVPVIKPVSGHPLSKDPFIFGKDGTENIVSCEVDDDLLTLFIEKNGQITTEIRPNKFWLLADRQIDSDWEQLKGDLHFRFIKYFDNKQDFYRTKNRYKENIFAVHDPKESSMILNGFTYYKGMKVNDVSIMHFDLETTGLIHNHTSRVLLISTTYISQGKTTKKLFAVDEYASDVLFLQAFCDYVREMNPSIISGFNIFGFDLPYLQHCADELDVELSLGRNDSKLRWDTWESKFRKDGSQDYMYKRCHIYGREIVDMMFVAYHFDFGRKYESYGLKKIIAHEKLEKPGRQFYDASLIAKNWDDPLEREKIKAYCIDDSDDNAALYNLMISAYFYLTPSVPKSFQVINYSASGSQLNAFLIRAYLQEGHSIPKMDQAVRFTGAISDANPGIYSNVFKVDVASLYPSIILQYEIYDPQKDPKKFFLKMVQYFTEERLKNKKLGKETGDRYYKDLEQAQKIVINSSFGLLGASGLNFNSPKNGALVTEYGRDILKKAILWATGKEYVEKVKKVEISEEVTEQI